MARALPMALVILSKKVGFAADDLDLGGLHGLAKHAGLGGGDVLLDVDLGEFDGLLLVEP
jgi:hypothetical protein